MRRPEQVMAYREEFLANGSRMDGTSALDKYADFDAWLAQLRKLKDPGHSPRRSRARHGVSCSG